MMSSAQGNLNFSFVISEKEGSVRWKGVQELVLGRDFRMLYERLERYCVRSLSPREVDLIVLSAALAIADRFSLRRLAHRWERAISLNIPVHDLDFWRDRQLQLSLTETLRYLTGDNWHLKFRARRESDAHALQLPLLSLPALESPIIPFSGGIDSFVMMQTSGEHSNHPPILLCATSNTRVKAVVARLSEFVGGRNRTIDIPFNIGKIRPAEPSYRTRTFIFFSLAALASSMMGSNCVLIGENGQGALGPSFATWGGEHPYRGTHPGFTARLSSFLTKVLEVPIRFEHPYVLMTKAEALKKVVHTYGSRGLDLTHSCSVNIGRIKGEGHPSLCGTCSGCILRRLAFHEVTRTHPISREQYFWDDLSAESLRASNPRGCPPSKNDDDIARTAVLNHRYLAEKASAPSGDPAFNRVAFEVSEAQGTSIDSALGPAQE